MLESTYLTLFMSSKASQMHFALILVKGAEEAWGIGLIGQRLPSRSSKMASSTLSSRNNGSQPAKAEIARERTLPSISGKNNGFSNIQENNYQ